MLMNIALHWSIIDCSSAPVVYLSMNVSEFVWKLSRYLRVHTGCYLRCTRMGTSTSVCGVPTVDMDRANTTYTSGKASW